MPEEQQKQHELEMRVRSSDPEDLFVTRRENALLLKELTSRMTLLILGSVALNQFLASTAVPSMIGASLAGVAALGTIGKVVMALVIR